VQQNIILFNREKKNIYKGVLREHLQRLTIARHLTRSSWYANPYKRRIVIDSLN